MSMSRSKTRFKFPVSFVVSYNYQECYYKPKVLIIEIAILTGCAFSSACDVDTSRIYVSVLAPSG